MCVVGAVRLVLAVAALGGAACAGMEEPELGEDRFFTCPEVDCGGNSPVVWGTPFHQLSENGAYNQENLRVVSLRKAGVSYELDVRGDRLRGLDAFGNPVLTGGQLQDAAIVLEKKGEAGFLYVHIVEATDAHLRFWIGDADPIWTYRLTWSFLVNPGSTDQDVCPLVAPRDPWGPANVMAIFFEGDTYDRHTKTVTSIGRTPEAWFNVACAGSAPAKLHATRHTTAGSDLEHSSSREERQAMLKMYTAAYCGTGRSFTTIGEELAWQNAAGWNGGDLHWQDDIVEPPPSWESVWTQDGAICLDAARLDEQVAGQKDLVLEECDNAAHDLPDCSDMSWFPDDWQSAPGLLVSADPTL
jgi:hypothetical protein